MSGQKNSVRNRKDIPKEAKDASTNGATITVDGVVDTQVHSDADNDADKLGMVNLENLSAAEEPVEWDYRIAMSTITVLAILTRFWGISHPNQVVFDEVHFGKFASHYLERTYFFDVHPPLGKLLFALMGWFVGYDGQFQFDNIGDSYIDNHVPYVAFRTLPAFLGALTVLVVFQIMWESGYTMPACILSASLILFDNAHIGQMRLILLDSTLVLAMACSLLCYIKFYKLRHEPFGTEWWKWLLLTGFALSCYISTKYVGTFSFVTIGSAVAIDLWDLFNIRRRQGMLSLAEFGKHFAARAVALLIVPFIIYLFWFQVHFAILTKSGPGDDFMSPEFQETLTDNPMTAYAVAIEYYDTIQIKHKETNAYLHSHEYRYPLRYDDGRVSSQGQQVTGYPYDDENNHWQILPSNVSDSDSNSDGGADGGADDDEPRYVMNNDIVRLRHIMTNTLLLSHDVASPYYSTNQEFTTVSMDKATERYEDTLFEIRIENGKEDQEFTSLSGQFKLIHNPSKVAMWTHSSLLPEWGQKQQEINGNKNIVQSSNVWFVDDIPSIPEDSPRLEMEDREVTSMPFLKKWFELQQKMFAHNNALTGGHPYSSEPYMWPFLIKGVSFWTDNDTQEQIYFIGNPIGWWIASSLLIVYATIVSADQLCLHRGIDMLDNRARSRLYNSTGFFFLAWAAHYLPFYLMGRQLFLHHYLPSHLASALVTGGLFEFICTMELDRGPASIKANKKEVDVSKDSPAREKLAGQSLLVSWAVLGVIMAAVIGGWYFFLPLTYGYPGLTVAEVQARKWLGFDLHFAK